MTTAVRVLSKVSTNIKQTNIKSLMLSGHCKRIYFSYSFPKNKAYRVKHIIQNKNFANGQYFTFCGMYHRVRLFKQFLELSSKSFYRSAKTCPAPQPRISPGAPCLPMKTTPCTGTSPTSQQQPPGTRMLCMMLKSKNISCQDLQPFHS